LFLRILIFEFSILLAKSIPINQSFQRSAITPFLASHYVLVSTKIFAENYAKKAVGYTIRLRILVINLQVSCIKQSFILK